MSARNIIIQLAFLAVTAAGAQAQTVVYVDHSAGGPTHDGSSWCDAYQQVHEALAEAAANGLIEEIRVADGTYLPDPAGLGDPRLATFQLINGVTLEGGYAGCGATDPDARDIGLYETILRGDIGTPGDDSDNCYHVVTGSNVDDTGVLDGFTISGGNAEGTQPGYNGSGGGMYTNDGSPTVTKCTFTGNSAEFYGGGMFNYNQSSPAVTACTFTGNSAAAGGGMFTWDHSHPTVTNCAFIGNSALGALADGGGMYNHTESDPLVTNCTFIGNSAGNLGGAVCNLGNCSPTLTNCTFSANSAVNDGGGMYNYASSPTLANCILWGNTPTRSQIYDDGASTSGVTCSCIEGGWNGPGAGPEIIATDPLFVAADDVRLMPDSPCINAGEDAAVPGDVTTDFEGDNRIQQCRVDMGVDETPYFRDCNDNSVADACDIATGVSLDVTPSGGDGVPDECQPVHNVTQGAVYVTIQEAIDNANPGDEIEVSPGTYVERINLLGQAITLRSTDGPEVTIIDGDADGGVITCVSGEGLDTLIVGFTITNGQATGGGGMYNAYSSPTLINCTFSGNSANATLAYGGGILNYESSPTLINCTFSGNSATGQFGYGGGMCNNANSSPTLTSCTFSGNWAMGTGTGNGGGMYNVDESSPTLTNCTFSGNSAEYGGGIFNLDDSSPALTNCTFSGNSADREGGGMLGWSSNYSTVANCIFWGNTAPTGPQVFPASTNVTYSCIQGGWSGAGNIDIDPLFFDPDGPDDDPSTWEDNNYRLDAGSPCVDAADNDAVPPDTHDLDGDGDTTEPTPYDRDGNARFVDDPDTPDTGLGNAPIVDVGAYEYHKVAGDMDGDLDVDGDDFGLFADCMAGPDVDPPADCGSADLDGDGDVDLADFALFMLQFTGPE